MKFGRRKIYSKMSKTLLFHVTQEDINKAINVNDCAFNSKEQYKKYWEFDPAAAAIHRGFPTEDVNVGPYDVTIGKLQYSLPGEVRDFNFQFDHYRFRNSGHPDTIMVSKPQPFSFELNIDRCRPWRSPYSTSEPNRSDLDE